MNNNLFDEVVTNTTHDFTSKEYSDEILSRLRRRYEFKCELLILTIENFVLEQEERRVRTDDVESKTSSVVRVLRRRRLERKDRTSSEPLYRDKRVDKLNIDELNDTLHILDDLYRDLLELIDFSESSGLLIEQDDTTVALFLEVLFVLLNQS